MNIYDNGIGGLVLDIHMPQMHCELSLGMTAVMPSHILYVDATTMWNFAHVHLR